MNIHEYQAKQIFSSYSIPTLKGEIATSVEQAKQVAARLARDSENCLVVVKAQIHAGGRGKAGGVKLCRSISEVEAVCNQLLGKPLITVQTKPEGQIVKTVYIVEGCEIDREIYLSLVLNRSTSTVSIIASAEGGVNIEEVAHDTPEKILKLSIDPIMGIQAFHIRKLFFFLNLDTSIFNNFSALICNLYKAYTETDANLIEINPLVITKQGELVALDAKVVFDDNALYRQPKIADLRDEDEEDPGELEAAKYDLNYVKLDGSIGCMVNGAGLAMATMDIIKLHGGDPANFLDVGGGATQERVQAAFKIILSDPTVKSILVNIFGGIMHCDIIAKGIVEAAKNLVISAPIVVRLQGTHYEQGKKIIQESGLKIITVDSLNDAAHYAVQQTLVGGI